MEPNPTYKNGYETEHQIENWPWSSTENLNLVMKQHDTQRSGYEAEPQTKENGRGAEHNII